MSEYYFDNDLDTAEPTSEPVVAQFYQYIDIVAEKVTWFSKEDLDDLAEYGNELIAESEDYFGDPLQVYLAFDASVDETTADGSYPISDQIGRTNIIGELSEFVIKQQDNGTHKLLARVTSTTVGIEGVYEKEIVAEGDLPIEIRQEGDGRNANMAEGIDGRMHDMHFDVTQLSYRMTDWRVRQTREFARLFQDSWCLESQHLWRYLGMKTMNMRDDQLLEYEVALNMYLEDVYRRNLSTKAYFVKPEVVNVIANDVSATQQCVALTHVGEEASLFALRLRRNSKDTQKLDVKAYLENCQDRDKLYELDVTSARDVLFGTLENIRRVRDTSL
ncbi:hypothetical protein GII36_01420 [Candidatus Mycosynbacter amalyticus]|uniref:Uncharacterized protein n=1 Tax=Candidatus Mycosynbacter amalyticus TaxID=2665156 RepID=A0A857MIX3_9BACT|nr:hypothetical protein [Candidatus Mycosynbacter amalyticus]QHN42506.1 hypothetical protein GII36_01420 [Candidatus Mycosynbacter amalyticus]